MTTAPALFFLFEILLGIFSGLGVGHDFAKGRKFYILFAAKETANPSKEDTTDSDFEELKEFTIFSCFNPVVRTVRCCVLSLAVWWTSSFFFGREALGFSRWDMAFFAGTAVFAALVFAKLDRRLGEPVIPEYEISRKALFFALYVAASAFAWTAAMFFPEGVAVAVASMSATMFVQSGAVLVSRVVGKYFGKRGMSHGREDGKNAKRD